jgi:3'-5' exoribonuclease
MKEPFVSDLQPNQPLAGVFLVQAKDVRQKKSGEPYLSLQLADKSGEIEAKMWDNAAEVAGSFERDDFVKIKGVTQIYQNRLQVTIHKMIRIEDSEVDLADFFPASPRNLDEMLAELRGIIAEMKDDDFRSLMNLFFSDEEFTERYKTAPAAKSIHHAWLGGLIEHVLSLCTLAKFTARHYQQIDLDLLLAGIILHDVGKVDELSYERGFYYSDEGQLLGHIFIGLRMMDERLRSLPDFPASKRMLLAHMILSHNGQIEFGSPKLPLFPEALLLHHLDNMDSKMECMRATAMKDNHVEGNWTSFSTPLGRAVLKKQRFVEGDRAPASVLPTTPPATSSSETTKPNRGTSARDSVFGAKLQQALGKN